MTYSCSTYDVCRVCPEGYEKEYLSKEGGKKSDICYKEKVVTTAPGGLEVVTYKGVLDIWDVDDMIGCPSISYPDPEGFAPDDFPDGFVGQWTSWSYIGDAAATPGFIEGEDIFEIFVPAKCPSGYEIKDVTKWGNTCFPECDLTYEGIKKAVGK